MDTNRDVFDTIFSLDLMELRQYNLVNQKESPVYIAVIKSSLLATTILQTYVFPEFIYWLVSSLYPQKWFMMKKLGENIF